MGAAQLLELLQSPTLPGAFSPPATDRPDLPETTVAGGLMAFRVRARMRAPPAGRPGVTVAATGVTRAPGPMGRGRPAGGLRRLPAVSAAGLARPSCCTRGASGTGEGLPKESIRSSLELMTNPNGPQA